MAVAVIRSTSRDVLSAAIIQLFVVEPEQDSKEFVEAQARQEATDEHGSQQ